jgi:DNA repair protein RecN (Recombination protein N)
MLEEVRISGLGVIDDAVLEFSPGFNVLTGETGAGKTMVVSGLGLLLGGRADPARVRPGAGRAAVEGRLRIPPASTVAAQVTEAGGDLDDGGGTLILSRSVSEEGRSRAFAGGRSVPVSLLIWLAEELVAVHGQADQRQLLRPSRQRAALDRFAGPALSGLLAEYRRAYRRHAEVTAALAELTTRAAERAAEAAELRRGLDDIERAGPAPGEDAMVAAEEERLAHADALQSAAVTAHEALVADPSAAGGYGAPDVLALLGRARQALESVAQHDPALGQLAGRLSEASYLVSDVAGELAGYAESVDADPARLAAVQERRAELARLIRAYGSPGPGEGGLAAVLAWAGRAAARLAELQGDDDRIGSLSAEEAALAKTVRELASRITQARTEAANAFAAEVTAELSALAMPDARVSVAVTPGEPGPDGADEVEIRLAAHVGAPPLPLHKGASGGELSRVMLAIEVVFAGADPVPTFVFDEVDAGVGGRAAIEVGRRLARLARRAQVIVVTHLPQVAAFADNHLLVEKSSTGSITRSGVTRLDAGRRVRELTRMLAGLEDSELGRAHATELLAAAEAERAGLAGHRS